jgi:hypothetical protein
LAKEQENKIKGPKSKKKTTQEKKIERIKVQTKDHTRKENGKDRSPNKRP